MRLCTECRNTYDPEANCGRLDGLTVSHGVCPVCAATWEAQLEQQLHESLRRHRMAEKETREN